MRIIIDSADVRGQHAEQWIAFFEALDKIGKRTKEKVEIALTGSWVRFFDLKNPVHKRAWNRLSKASGFKVL